MLALRLVLPSFSCVKAWKWSGDPAPTVGVSRTWARGRLGPDPLCGVKSCSTPRLPPTLAFCMKEKLLSEVAVFAVGYPVP